jgi:hypothetical protein
VKSATTEAKLLSKQQWLELKAEGRRKTKKKKRASTVKKRRSQKNSNEIQQDEEHVGEMILN